MGVPERPGSHSSVRQSDSQTATAHVACRVQGAPGSGQTHPGILRGGEGGKGGIQCPFPLSDIQRLTLNTDYYYYYYKIMK